MNPMMAQIIMFAGNFAPRGWAFCEGQLLKVSQYSALFSLLGTTYGGDGRETFALPDFRGRAPLHPGTGPGLGHIIAGQKGGAEVHTLTEAEMPMHNHTAVMMASPNGADDDAPSTAVSIGAAEIYVEAPPTEQLMVDSVEVDNTGSSQPFSIRNPYIGCNYIIALQGVYPSKS